jgi:hypothetical protein
MRKKTLSVASGRNSWPFDHHTSCGFSFIKIAWLLDSLLQGSIGSPKYSAGGGVV